jgi:hypothetical protein
MRVSGESTLTTAKPEPLQSRWALAAWFLAFAIVSRFSVFGDTNYFNDEYFYFQGGLRLWQGELPYVDVWDRKGPGLFLTYALAGAFSSSVIAYQTLALLFAGATAWCVAAIARRFTTPTGAALGGTLYLVLLVFFGGGGGQSPVFYNLWVALAALGVLRARPAIDRSETPPALYAAMASAGFALTFKQTAICESLFLGLFALWRLRQAGVAPPRLAGIALILAAAGIAPMALFAAFYALAGHFAEFWHAMVTANLAKSYNPAGDATKRIATLAMLFAPALLPALIGAVQAARGNATPRLFLAGWLVAALAGFAVVPNFYEHYLLPVCLPVSVAAAAAFGAKRPARLYGIALIVFGLLLGPAFDLTTRSQSRTAMAAMAADIRASAPAPRLLVYEGPVDLYRQVGVYPPTALYYPLHLYFPAEHNVSHVPTADATRSILAWRPTAVVTYRAMPAYEENQATARLVHAYIAENCRRQAMWRVPEVYSAHEVELWLCAEAG